MKGAQRVNCTIETRRRVDYIVGGMENRSSRSRTIQTILAPLRVLSVAIVVLLASSASLLAQPDEQMARAQEAIDSGNIQGAVDILDKAVKKKPPNAEAFLLRSTAHFVLGDIDAGRRDLDRALEIAPRLRQAWLNRAALDLADGKYDGALEALEQAQRIDPTASDNDLNIGAVLVLQGKLQDASASFARYLKNNSTSADAYYLVATNFAMAGYAGPATEYLRTAIQLDEKSRLRARTDPNFSDLAGSTRFQQVISSDTYTPPPGAYIRTTSLDLPYQGPDSLLLRAVLDALQFSGQQFDPRVEATADWALIWGEMRIKIANDENGKATIQLTAPPNRFTPSQWENTTNALLKELTLRLATRSR